MAVYNIKKSRKRPDVKNNYIKWIIDNLFSTPLNVAITFLILLSIIVIVPPFINWAIIDATFIGDTKADCLGDGACWIFIKNKLYMFIYGLYPQNEAYRLNISFALFFVYLILAKYIIKILYKKIILFFIYMFISYILIFGGYFGLEFVDTSKLGGLVLTLIIATTSILASFPFGIILAFARQSKLPVIKNLSILYIEFIRGVPLITLLFMGSVLLPLFFPEGIDFNKLLRALIIISLFQSAYIAEVIRGGLQSISKGQYEASYAFGLSYWQTMLLVILPQALKVSIPNLVGASISLFKDTSLVLIIGLFDLLAMVHLSNSDSAWLGNDIEGYVFVTFIYWFFCYMLSKYSKILEKRFNTNNN